MEGKLYGYVRVSTKDQNLGVGIISDNQYGNKDIGVSVIHEIRSSSIMRTPSLIM